MPILNKVAKAKLIKEAEEMDHLHNTKGLTYNEIGKLYGISGQGVYYRITRLLKQNKN